MADFAQFKTTMLNTGRIDFDHQLGFQCVDLDRQWWYENGILNTGGNPTAISYWTHPPQSLLDACERLETSDAIAGDTVILRTKGTAPGDFSGDGHITLGTGNNTDSQVEILEQNGSTGSGDGLGGNAIRTRFVDRSRVAGIYRLRQSVVLAAAPHTPPAVSVPSGKYVVLPASVSAWAAYRVGSSLRKGTTDQVGTLDPAEFGGLKYEIQGWISDKAVIVGTESFGQVALWVKDTDAQFVNDEPAAPAAPDYASLYKFERLASPLNVQTKGEQHLWNLQFAGGFANAQSIAAVNTAFQAVGKATKLDMPEHPVYYLSNESFGQADTTGVPAFWQGINTVDLEPADVKPTAETVTTPVPEITEDGAAEAIEVKVNPPANPDSWKTSFKTNEAGEYIAQVETKVADLDGKLDTITLPAGARINISGKFIGPDKVEYWRSEKSASRVDPSTLAPKEEDWRGIPVMDPQGNDVLKEDQSMTGWIDSNIDDFASDIRKDAGLIRHNIIRTAANVATDAEGWVNRLRKRS